MDKKFFPSDTVLFTNYLRAFGGVLPSIKLDLAIKQFIVLREDLKLNGIMIDDIALSNLVAANLIESSL